MKSQITKLTKSALVIGVAALLLLGWGGAARAHDDDHHDSDSKGLSESKTLLSVFQDTYWRWVFGNITLPTDQNNNAVLRGIALMPLPNTSGDGTPGSIDVTLKAEQPFFLPLWGFLGTSYNNGAHPDPFVDLSIFKTLSIKLTIDGKTVVNQKNAMDFYTQFTFVPPVPLNFDIYDSLIWFQHIGILQEPLSPGKHVLKLDVKNTKPAPGLSPELHGISEYHNTFNVTVQPKVH